MNTESNQRRLTRHIWFAPSVLTQIFAFDKNFRYAEAVIRNRLREEMKIKRFKDIKLMEGKQNEPT